MAEAHEGLQGMILKGLDKASIEALTLARESYSVAQKHLRAAQEQVTGKMAVLEAKGSSAAAVMDADGNLTEGKIVYPYKIIGVSTDGSSCSLIGRKKGSKKSREIPLNKVDAIV